MEDNWTILRRETTGMENTLVLDFPTVYMFRKLVDGDDDYYYKLVGIDGKHILLSCVGGLIFLKKSLEEKEYKELVRLWNLNSSWKAG